jgi:hypothetical protein
MIKDFNPWTATQEEAEAEDKRREPIIKALSAELKKQELGSKEWQAIRYELDPISIEATRQREVAQEILKKRSEITNSKKKKQTKELELLGLIYHAMRAFIALPAWFINEFYLRLTPIWLGKKNNFDHWRTGSSATHRKNSLDISLKVYDTVSLLLKERTPEGKKKYSTGLEDKKSVWELISKQIEKEYNISGYSPGTARRDYYKLKDMYKKIAETKEQDLFEDF